ncbi:MAG: KAP family NTPase, partial [Acidobacteria bacterium]|nr:KAP family NTPase [Acidobacteriota bacterium]
MKSSSDNSRLSEWLSADRPIQTRQEDLLGRSGFSEALANAIRGWSGRESLILALYGAWGSGKSSIKNMVVESLRSDSSEIPILDFNPWQHANRPALSEAFFDELGVTLGKGDLGSNSLRRSVLAKYKRWAHRLQGGRDLVRGVRSLFGFVLVFLGVVTLGAAWVDARAISIILGIVLLLVGALAFLSDLFGAAIKFLEAGTDVGAKSISEVKAEIAGDLKKLKTPILVIHDDLDRLTPRETLEVFQLIKTNGDFPNLVYVVLCDRLVVEANVKKELNVSGRDYLEKIVQVAFDVPMIDLTRVHQVLFQRLDLLLSPQAVTVRFSKKRWVNVFLSGLRPYFATLRDVNRFMSTLAFQFSSFHADDAFEVNPIDLIILEVIRLYEPEAYRQLRRNKEILTTNSRPQGQLADTTQKAVTAIIETAEDDRKDQLKELIKHLFPTVEWALEGVQYADGAGDQWYRDLRVCSKKVFDRYFRLTLAENEISQAVVQKLILARGDRERLRSELEKLNSSGLLKTAFEELAVNEQSITADEAEQYTTAIFDVADLVSDEAKGMFEVPVAWQVAFLVRSAMEKLDGPGERVRALITSISNTNGLFMPVEFVALIDAPPKSGGEPPLLSEKDIAEAKVAVIRKIEGAATSGALAELPRAVQFFHCAPNKKRDLPGNRNLEHAFRF